jgi:hypothetical protein
MFGRDLEKTILELYRHVLAERGIEIEKLRDLYVEMLMEDFVKRVL